MVRRADAIDRVCLGSFGLARPARGPCPRAGGGHQRRARRGALGALSFVVPLAGRRASAYAGYQVPEWPARTRVVSPRFVDDAHRAGLGVQVWTVDTAEPTRTPDRLGRRRADHRPAGSDRAAVSARARQHERLDRVASLPRRRPASGRIATSDMNARPSPMSMPRVNASSASCGRRR